MKVYKKLVVELDLTSLDDSIRDLKQIKAISIDYENISEGNVDWGDYVKYKIIEAIKA